MKTVTFFTLIFLVIFLSCKKEVDEIKQTEVKSNQEYVPELNPENKDTAGEGSINGDLIACFDSIGVSHNPPEEIVCFAYFESWFYNDVTNSCELIGYTDCSPRGFQTKEDCEECSVSDSPPDIINGPDDSITCTAYFESWFYDNVTNSCQKIGYSGCSPLGSSTEEECLECKCR